MHLRSSDISLYSIHFLQPGVRLFEATPLRHRFNLSEEILQRAGIERARGLIAAISTDADNVYVTLTAKGLRPDLMVVARAQEERAEKKLLKAGANKVILPYQSAGQILAHSALKPNVVQFIESVTAGDMANRAGCCRRHEEIGGNRELSRDHSVLNVMNEL